MLLKRQERKLNKEAEFSAHVIFLSWWQTIKKIVSNRETKAEKQAFPPSSSNLSENSPPQNSRKLLSHPYLLTAC